MDMSDATEGASFWQLHIAAWQQSGLTQKAYCEQQELRYSTFGYWVRKLRRAAEPATNEEGGGLCAGDPGHGTAHRPDPEPAQRPGDPRHRSKQPESGA